LSDTSAASCAKALVFSSSGMPKTITSNRGPQFTWNIWTQFCKMLHISHRQTMAYHLESNSAFEQCPYAVLLCGSLSFTIRVRSWDEIVSVSRLKACTEADSTRGSPRHCGRLPGKRLGSPASTKHFWFSDRWFLHLLLPRHCQAMVLELFFRSRTGFLHTLDQRRHPCLHSSGTRTVSGHRLKDWTSDLSSFQPMPELSSSPVETSYTPGWRSNQLALYPSTLVHSVQSLYISCYVLSYKVVLLYLLLCLLPQWPWSSTQSRTWMVV
jgi:hypothetical protein